MPLKSVRPYQEIHEMLKERTRGMWDGGMKFLSGSGREYWLPRNADLNGILERSRITHEGPRGDVCDCDDYAIVFKSRLSYLALKTDATQRLPIAAGIFWGLASWMPTLNNERHAANWFLTRQGRLIWIEPWFGTARTTSADKD